MALVFWGDSMTNLMLSNANALAVFTNVGQVVFNGGVDAAPAQTLIDTFRAKPERKNWAHVFYHVHHGGGQPDQEPYVQDMIEEVGHGDFMVVSGVNDGYAANYQGPSGERYLAMKAYNATMSARYPDKYLDLHGTLVADGLAIEDEQSILYDAPPSTYAPTDIHFNETGWVRQAQVMLAKLQSMGLLAREALDRQIARSGGR